MSWSLKDMGGTVLVVRREDQAIVGRHRDKAHALVQVSALEKVSFATRSEAGRYAANMRWKDHVKGGSTRKEFAYNKVDGYLGSGIPEHSTNGLAALDDMGALFDSEAKVGKHTADADIVRYTDRYEDKAIVFKKLVMKNLGAVLNANLSAEELDEVLIYLKSKKRNHAPLSADTKDTGELVASNIVRQWAASSNDSNVVSLMVQSIVEEEFGLTGAAAVENLTYTGAIDANAVSRTEMGQNPVVVKAFTLMVHAQYDATQAYLKANGITSVELVRGATLKPLYEDILEQKRIAMKDGTTIFPDEGVLVREVQMRPLSSWTASVDVAYRFANDYGGGPVHLKSIVPASRVFSLPFTGIGSLVENEVVVLGGKQTVIATDSAIFNEGLTLTDMETKEVVKAVGDIINIDDTMANYDWIKANAFDFPSVTNLAEFIEQLFLPSDPKLLRDALASYAGMQRLGMEKVSFATRSEAGRYAANMRWKGHVKGSGEKGFTYNKVAGFVGGTVRKPKDGMDLFDLARESLPIMTERNSRDINNVIDVEMDKDSTAKRLVQNNLAAVLNANMTPEELVAAGDALLVLKMGIGAEKTRNWAEGREAHVLAIKAVDAWAGSSNDANIVSLAVQRIVAREFGLTDTTELSQVGWSATGNMSDLEGMVDELLATPQLNKALTLMVHAQYDATQAFLKAQGVESVELHRGMISATLWNDVSAIYGGKNEEQPRDLQSRPLSSWAVNKIAAVLFLDNDLGEGGDGTSVMLRRTVPRSQIFSTPFTGIGCLKETEMVILGGIHETAAQAYPVS